MLKVPPPQNLTASSFFPENSNGLEIVGVEEAKRFTIGSQLLAYLFFVGGETFAVSFREGGSDTSTSSGMEVSINVGMAVLSQAGRWAKALALSFEAFVKRGWKMRRLDLAWASRFGQWFGCCLNFYITKNLT